MFYYYFRRYRLPLAVLLIMLLAMLLSAVILPRLALAGPPVALPYTNEVKLPDTTGDPLTLHMAGELAVLFHGRFYVLEGAGAAADSCGAVQVPVFMGSYALMVKPDLEVTDDYGGSYRIHGHFKVDRSRSPLSMVAVCLATGVYAFQWQDSVEIIGPDSVRNYTLTFYTEVDIYTGELLTLEVIGHKLG